VLTGATIGVFVAQDLLDFYVFFEAILIPLSVLIGVWGAAGARLATFLGRAIEAPIILGSVGEIAGGVRSLGRRVAATQSGVLRAYAILIAVSAAVIVLVFIAVR
jgi:NADH:ubiquinone oxidoreductase subunit 5 (subunit L)/multisubunit Na+/H+ antiporter MnhA subunit